MSLCIGSEPVPITLQEAMQRALHDNLILQQSRLDERAARWGMVAAISDVLPQVRFNSSYSRFDEETVFRQNIFRDVIIQQYNIDPKDFPPFVYKDYFSSSISVDQPIYNGGVEITALHIASSRKKQIRYSRMVQERATSLQAETAYYNLCRAQQALEIQRSVLELTELYLKRFQHQRELGLITDTDMLRWEVQKASEESALIEAENALTLSQLALAQAVGSGNWEAFYPADLDILIEEAYQDTAVEVLPLEHYWSTTLANSPDLQIIQEGVNLEKQNLWLASGNFQPKVNFNYIYSWESDNDLQLDGFTSWVASVNVSMPLFASFGNVARWQEARVNFKRSQEGAKDFEIGLRLQLTAAYQEWESALARLSAARKMQQQAAEVLSNQENRHSLGLITTLELLDARNTAKQAELNLINARFDALIARSKLARIAGM
ncbi:MAG: TolC family protein [bacterium]